jgi:xanthine dehydrogenase accessory factor
VVRCEPPTSARPGDRAIVTADGRFQGWVGGACAEPLVRHEAARALVEGTPRLVHIAPAVEAERSRDGGEVTVATTCPSGGALDIFVEPRLPRPLLIVFGGTPVARMLVKLAHEIGFRTCAVHPGAGETDFPGADAVLGELDLSSVMPAAEAWAVVTSMGHYDEDAIACALAANPDLHVGLVASSRRAATVMAGLRDRGVEEAELSRVHAPAGGARASSQAEIALLVLAEIVTQRSQAGRDRRPAAPEPERFAVDPVCGMSVEIQTATHTLTQADRDYYFCCASCKERFAADPERFTPLDQ